MQRPGGASSVTRQQRRPAQLKQALGAIRATMNASPRSGPKGSARHRSHKAASDASGATRPGKATRAACCPPLSFSAPMSLVPIASLASAAAGGRDRSAPPVARGLRPASHADRRRRRDHRHHPDYTTGRVATLASTLSAMPAATTSAAIPANILYAPTSDEAVYRTATLYFYADGLRWRFTGAVGTWSLELSTGGIGVLVSELRAQPLDKSLAALPTGWNTTTGSIGCGPHI
jgi:hypothetical protein